MKTIEMAMNRAETIRLDADRAEAGRGETARVEELPSARRSARVEIDLGRLEREGILLPDRAGSAQAEEFQLIKRTLLGNHFREDGPQGDRSGLIVVTSAVPGEGKTFCAINLAMSLALEVDTAVLLVDADVLRPAVLPRLGLHAGRGLLDVLSDERCKLPDVMLSTNVPKLSLLHTGRLHPHATELLASASMDHLLSELGSRYRNRIVIFDAPPLLATTSAVALASRVGQVLMVVEASRTSRREVAQAFAAVERCPNVMSVLNRCDTPMSRHRYGYYAPIEPTPAARGWRSWFDSLRPGRGPHR